MSVNCESSRENENKTKTLLKIMDSIDLISFLFQFFFFV